MRVLQLRDCRGLAAMLHPSRPQPSPSLQQFVHKQAARANAATRDSASNGHSSSGKSSTHTREGGSRRAPRCSLRLLDLRGCVMLPTPPSHGSQAPATGAITACLGNISLGGGQVAHSATSHSVLEAGKEGGAAALFCILQKHGCTVLD